MDFQNPHHLYVAGAYGFAALVLGGLIVHTLLLRAASKKTGKIKK